MGIMLNLDCNIFYHSRRNIADSIDEKAVRDYINQYRDTSVTDLILNVGDLLSSTPSKIRTTYLERAKYAKEKGIDWGCTNAVLKLDELGIDPYTVWIDQNEKNGINTWFSFRMNDAHNLLDDTPLTSEQVRSMFKTCSIIRHRRQIGWYDRCQDYSREEVRKYHLDYIEEQVMQYLPYGIELDFQRELNCFRPGFEWEGMDVILGFMKEVREIVSRAEKKAGKKIKILIRCNQNPKYCMEWGFDIVEMARLGLIDAFAPTPRWNCSDTDIPVKLWKRILAPYNIPVIPGIDAQNIHPYPDDFMMKKHTVCNTVATTFAIAAGLLSQGADGIYLFNYFNEIPTEMISGEKRELAETDSIFEAAGYYKILLLAANYEEVVKQKRKHIITYNDKTPIFRDSEAVLPMTVGNTEQNEGFFSNGEVHPRYLRFLTGKIPTDKHSKVRFRIGTEGFDVNDVEIYVNCSRAEFEGVEEQGEPYYGVSPVYGDGNNGKTPDVYAFRIPNDALRSEVQVAEILLKEGKERNRFVIDYADIIVE